MGTEKLDGVFYRHIVNKLILSELFNMYSYTAI